MLADLEGWSCEAEREIYHTKPYRYGSIALQVDLAMEHSYKHCLGGDCDEDACCQRHARTPEVIDRYLRIKNVGR